MGMFDTLGDDYQVKCFNVPCFYYSQYNKDYKALGYMGGLLRYFGEGYRVPTHTLWYKYPDNFIIIDTSYWDYSEEVNDSYYLLHIIKKNRYIETVTNVSDLTKHYLEPIKTIDYYGDYINFDSTTLKQQVEDIEVYIKEDLRIQKEKIVIIDKYRDVSDRFINLLKNKKDVKNLEEDTEYIEVKKKYDESYKFEQEELRALTNDFNTKYHCNDDTIVDGIVYKRLLLLQDVGGYIQLHGEYKKNTYIENDKKKALCQEFKRRVEDNKVSIEEYIDWNQPIKNKIDSLKKSWYEMMNGIID